MKRARTSECHRVLKSVPRYLCSTIGRFNKNAHTCKKSVIEIDKTENIEDIFSYTLLFFTRKNSQKRNQISYRDLKWRIFTVFHFEVKGNTSRNFQRYHPDLLQCKIPVDIPFLSRVLKHYILSKRNKSEKKLFYYQIQSLIKQSVLFNSTSFYFNCIYSIFMFIFYLSIHL